MAPPYTYSELRPRRIRSRNGCLSCRRRRKKCDEQKPSCVACQRNKIVCSWPEEIDNDVADSENSQATDTATAIHEGPSDDRPADRIDFFLDIFRAACAQPRPRLNPELSIQLSANIHHYIDHTAKDLGDLTPTKFRSIWTDVVIEDAKTFPFVMSSLDAIASLHRAIFFPGDSQKNIEFASQSHAASINEFCSVVSEINPENATGTLTFAAIQVILCLEFPISLKLFKSPSIIDGAYELLISIRGFYRLQSVAHPYIVDSILGAWISDCSPLHPSTPGNSFILRDISRLYQMVKGLDFALDPTERNICYMALGQMYTFFAETVLEPLTWPVLFKWPILIPEQFLKLIHNRNPLALIVLSHWFMHIFGNSRHWLLHGWSKQLCHDIVSFVSPEWHIALEIFLDNEVGSSHDMGMETSVIELGQWAETQRQKNPYLSG